MMGRYKVLVQIHGHLTPLFNEFEKHRFLVCFQMSFHSRPVFPAFLCFSHALSVHSFSGLAAVHSGFIAGLMSVILSFSYLFVFNYGLDFIRGVAGSTAGICRSGGIIRTPLAKSSVSAPWLFHQLPIQYFSSIFLSCRSIMSDLCPVYAPFFSAMVGASCVASSTFCGRLSSE